MPSNTVPSCAAAGLHQPQPPPGLYRIRGGAVPLGQRLGQRHDQFRPFGRPSRDQYLYRRFRTFSNNYGVSGQCPFSPALRGINTIRAAKVMRLLGVEELQRVKDEVALNTMQAYFDVVYFTPKACASPVNSWKPAPATSKSRKLLELGLKSAADVAEQGGTVRLTTTADAAGKQPRTGQDHACRNDELSARPPPGDRDGSRHRNPGRHGAPFSDVVAYALDNNPKARSAGYNVRQSKLQYSVARGGFFPSVYVGGGYSTNFFMSLDDHSLYEPFKNQFRDNRGYYFSAQLNIPIFGGFRAARGRTAPATTGGSPSSSAIRRCVPCKAKSPRTTSRCSATARSSCRPAKKARPPSWPTTPSPASTTGAWFRRSTFRPPPTTCCRPAPNGCVPGCNTLSKRAWSSITTVRP